MASSTSSLRRFFGGILSIYRGVRSLRLNIVFVLVLLLVIAALVGEPPIVVQPGSALLLNPNGVLVEQESYADPLTLITRQQAGAEGNGEILLQDLLDAINTAAADDRIDAMLILTDGLQGAGISQLFDLNDAIDSFRASGKKVYAHGSSFSQGQYLLASAADEVLMHDFGGVALEGFGVWQNYFQQALVKLGINVHIFRVGEFKSAVEPYSRSDMSPESRSNYSRLLNDLWLAYVERLETNRELATGTINDYINNHADHLAEYQGNSADLALAMSLVDRLDSQPAATAYLEQQLGTRDGDLAVIGFQDYLLASPTPTATATDQVAVIVAEGEIVDGEAPPGTIGGDTLSNLIRETTDDNSVKALVVRINSPGGSAFASELIRAELAAFQASGRPLVVSMGDTAASGGYWIAAGADEIWANPATVTGSIGIFGMMFTLEETFNKLGIGTDGVGTTELAGFSAAGRPLSELASRTLQFQIEHGYQRFITLVAEARDLDQAEVESLAQGQVWSGQAAIDNGLVDSFGSLQAAIDSAANLAGLNAYEVIWPSLPLSPFEQLLQQAMENATVQSLLHPLSTLKNPTSAAQLLLQKAVNELDWLLQAKDPQHIYASCLECQSLRLP